MIPFGQPLLGDAERDAVLHVMRSTQLVHGPEALRFESEFAQFIGKGVSATSVSSATAGLYLAYAAVGVVPGTDVVVPALTHVATAHSAYALGAEVRFADVEADSGNVNVDLISEAVTPKTRAICVVHYLGLPVDMAPIMQFANERGIAVVEDCALALGAVRDGVPVGTWGDFGVFSFYPAKHITTGEGGMVISRSQDGIARVQSMKAFGYDRTLSERRIPGVYDIKGFGLNLRMSEIAAAIGSIQLSRAPDFASVRLRNSEWLRGGLSAIEGVEMQRAPAPGETHAHYCEIAKMPHISRDERDRVAILMKDAGVGTSVYYPVPLPKSGFYSTRPTAQMDPFPGASSFSDQSIALPIGPHIEPDDVDTIVAALTESIQEIKRD
jgi:perosamine synthetase